VKSGEAPLRADAQRNRAAILVAAASTFAERGPAATTEEVATRAGVAVGTVFRHFPTKDALLAAIMKQSLLRLSEQGAGLDDPASALFDFITLVVDEAASTRTVVEALARQGVDVEIGSAVQALQDTTAALLLQAQQADAVRPDVQVDEVMALLTATSQGALHAAWDPGLRRRTLAIVFTGLKP